MEESDNLQEAGIKSSHATTSKKVVNILLDILSGHGVAMSICSPGSRNIPLLLGIKAHSDIDYRVVTDERTSAFMALGLSVTTGHPVMLACTSGTALLNYAPAVAEAFYQGVPLIVVSADRPEEWIDQDDSQTIRQFGALANIVKKSYDISDTDIERPDGTWYAERIFNDAMLVAASGKPGPVHINIRFTPPLGLTVPYNLFDTRIIHRINPLCEPKRAIIRQLAHQALNSRILLVAGFMAPNHRINRAVNKFRQHTNVVVMAETISNLHLPSEDYVIDTMLRATRPGTPDLIISIGGALVSRMLKEYLRDIAGHHNLTHWSVGYNHTTVDCFKSLTSTIECNPATFLSQLSAEMAHLVSRKGHSSPYGGYKSEINKIRKEAISKLTVQTEDAGWSEAQAFGCIMQSIPECDNVCISNGTSIRYAQLYTRRLQHAHYCNRGVSGIDGSTATAIGISMGFRGRTWLVTGDMSLTYDTGTLHEVVLNNTHLNIIVIANRGGGIFRYISSSRELEIRNEMLCHDTNYDFRQLAHMYGFKYLIADSLQSLQDNFEIINNSSQRYLLEIRSDADYSARILNEILKS